MKSLLSRVNPGGGARGATVLIYHRVGGGSPDERDLPVADFAAQLDALQGRGVVPIDEAVTRLERGDERSSFVVTFDDGFRDVYDNAWPLLRSSCIPFTIYLATAFIGDTMHWDGSTAKDTGAPALTWEQLSEMVESGLCTVGNHTHTHVRPELLSDDELDKCTADIEGRLGVTPRHFAYTWGVPVPALERSLRPRFRSAATGELGRNLPGDDPLRLRRIPVRQSDPIAFFRAKLEGGLLPERAYGTLVAAAKRAGARA
ncbi:MAG: polysaccharide deacetylase family protein [Actinomycetes bacterium]